MATCNLCLLFFFLFRFVFIFWGITKNEESQKQEETRRNKKKMMVEKQRARLLQPRRRVHWDAHKIRVKQLDELLVQQPHLAPSVPPVLFKDACEAPALEFSQTPDNCPCKVKSPKSVIVLEKRKRKKKKKNEKREARSDQSYLLGVCRGHT